MTGYAFRKKSDVKRISRAVKANERAGRTKGSVNRRQVFGSGGSADGQVVLFRCGATGCLEYKLVSQSDVVASNMSSLFNSVSGWLSVDDSCAGDESGDTFQSNSLTAEFGTSDVVVVSTDDNSVYQRSTTDDLFYEIP